MDFVQLVRQLYLNELGREPTQAEMQPWIDQLVAGNLSQQQVADMIERSPEGVSYDINRIYKSELGRDPEQAGIDQWARALSSGAMSDDQMLSMVRQSPEYQTRMNTAPTLTPAPTPTPAPTTPTPTPTPAPKPATDYTDLLNRTYMQEVGRAPTAAEMQPWIAQLNAGNITPDQLPAIFSNTNEGWVYDQYGTLFKRAPDADAANWVKQLEGGSMTRDQVMQSLMASPEYLKLNPTKNPPVPVPKPNTPTGAGPGMAAAGVPSYVNVFSNYAPMKAMPDPRSQTFGFLYDTIQQRLGKQDPSMQQGLLGLQSIVPTQAAAQSPINWAPGAQQQTPASTGGYTNGNDPNIVGGLLNARNLVSGAYQSLLNRAPDDAGMNAWSKQVLGGMTQQQLYDALKASPEYQNIVNNPVQQNNSSGVFSYTNDGGGN